MKFCTSLFLVFFTVFLSQSQTITKVKIEGNKRTRTNFLKRLAFVKDGSTLDTLRISSDIRRLKLLPGIANAESKVKNLGNGNVEVIYTVEENFAIIPGLNISQDVNEDFAFRTSIFDFNFLGRNQIIGGYYARNVFNSFGVFWEAPNLFTRKLGIGLNYQNNVTLEPIFFSNANEADFKFDSRAFEIKLQYEHNFNNRFELGVNIASETYDFDNGSTATEIPNNLASKKVALIGEYEYNNINIDYQYQSGFSSLLTYAVNLSATGDADFLRQGFMGRNDFAYFKRVAQKGNWANRLRLAYATNNDTPLAPFAIDNQLNIRGIGNSVGRGTASIVLNIEYRYTLYEKGWFVLQSNAFLDAGTWREPNTIFGDLFKNESARASTGLGLRFIHKRIFNAVFRLDYGIGILNNNANGLVFGIGQYF